MTLKQILHQLNRRDTRLLAKKNNKFKPLIVCLLILCTIIFTKQIIAQTTTSVSDKIIQDLNNKQAAFGDGKVNAENWSKENLITNQMLLLNTVIGEYPFSNTTSQERTSWVPGGLLQVATKTISMTYNIPISGIQYIAELKDNFLGKPTYAATGFQGMSPLLPLWKGFRNITYAIFSILFIIIGIMIMLRVKISPQTTITIQSAIPKIITSLILVTFSYAIVGLLIDFSYLISNLGISLIYQATGDSSAITNTTGDFWSRVWSLSMPWNGYGLIDGLIGTIIPGAVGAVLGFISGILGFILGLLIITLVVVFNLFKFMFGLIKCYINIILHTILAPLEIAIGAIPNIKVGFGSWFMNIFANLMVFPITSILVVLIKKIMDIIWYSNDLWIPTGLDGNSSTTPTHHFISLAIGFGSVLLLAKLPNIIPEFIFQLKPSPLGKAIGEGLGSVPGVKLGQAGMNMARQNVFDKGTKKVEESDKEHIRKRTNRSADSQGNAPPATPKNDS